MQATWFLWTKDQLPDNYLKTLSQALQYKPKPQQNITSKSKFQTEKRRIKFDFVFDLILCVL